MSFGMVVYMYCGVYIASPSLASAGGVLEKVAYGVSIPGFIMTSTLWVHIAAKFVRNSGLKYTFVCSCSKITDFQVQLFVRILRDSEHLQKNGLKHWTTWL